MWLYTVHCLRDRFDIQGHSAAVKHGNAYTVPDRQMDTYVQLLMYSLLDKRQHSGLQQALNGFIGASTPISAQHSRLPPTNTMADRAECQC